MDNTTDKKTKYRYFLRKNILALLILLMIFGYAGINIRNNYETYAQTIRDEYRKLINGESSIRDSITVLEDSLTETAVERMKFVEVFSFGHVLLGKEEIKNFSYIKDRNGVLHYAAFFREHDMDLFALSLRVKRLQEAVAEKGTKVIVAIAPSKTDLTETEFSAGLPYNDTGREVDELLLWLNRLGIPTINYGEYMPNKKLPFEETFYRTDHHWTIGAALYATEVLVDKMNEVGGYDLPGEAYLSPEQYDVVVYPDAMLGTMGRGSGVNFAGLEDFKAYLPKWEKRFKRESLREDGRIETTEGGCYETLINLDVLNRTDLYKNQAYSMYMNAIRYYDHVENLDQPDGISVLMVRDSYFGPVMTFLAPMTGKIDSIWLLEDSDAVSVEGLLAERDYDCIIIELYPYNIGEDAFQFFVE